MTTDRSERSCAPLTTEHLARLSTLADEDHALFAASQPAYAERRVAVVLAQGAALHYLDGTTGVKDLDVWSFYAAVPGVPGNHFPGLRWNRHVDFGPSELGRWQLLPHSAAQNDREWRMWQRWHAEHTGRRVDLLRRPLDVPPGAPVADVVHALRVWLRAGRSRSARELAAKAMIVIDPGPARETVVWPVGRFRSSGIHNS